MRRLIFFLALLLIGGCGSSPTPVAESPAPDPPSVPSGTVEPTEPSVQVDPPAGISGQPLEPTTDEQSLTPADPATADDEPPEPQRDAAESTNPTAPVASERILLFAETEPVLIDLQLLIDGRPYDEPLTELCQRVLEIADTNGDGKATWEEITRSPRFRYGQFGNLEMADDAARLQVKRLYDNNSNGRVDLDELPRFLTRNAGGARPFSMKISNRNREFNRLESPLRHLLDADYDGLITTAEIVDAPFRLLQRDANDDEAIQLSELPGAMEATQANRRSHGPPPCALIDRFTRLSVVQSRLEKTYSSDVATPYGLMLSYRNASGEPETHLVEYKDLQAAQPHVVIQAAFGKPSAAGALGRGSITMVKCDPRFHAESLAASTQRVQLRLPRTTCLIYINDQAPTTNDAEALQLLAAYDVDKNGYLEETEVPEGQAITGDTFAAADTDSDGKLYQEELVAFTQDRSAVLHCQIRGMAIDQTDALFALLDINGDQRLDAQEIRLSNDRLLELDTNQSAELNIAEIPQAMQIGLVRGNPQQGDALFTPPTIVEKTTDAPRWFEEMDRNADGLISQREFLGELDLFNQLDTDKNGFVDLKEAQAPPR